MKKYLWILVGLGVSFSAGAEIYKHVDPVTGKVTYSDKPDKGSTKVDLVEPVSPGSSEASGSSAKAQTPTPASFPKVEKNEQKDRDTARRKILEQELADEQQKLEEAKQAYAEGESKPEVYRTKDGKVKRSMGRYLEKMDELQSQVDEHQRNVDMLEKDLANLGGGSNNN
ncbi:MAG: DUF4124 domain-containing protein [Methylobacillus sp.]|jgi:uncharacterized phage infection (PIP) family protein YhgE|nr:DUF4124 domain-containing protein [Methylobacillus sp.]